jgi:hypothetical protein
MSTARNHSSSSTFLQAFVGTRRRHGTLAALGCVAERLAHKVIGLSVSHAFCFDLEGPQFGTASSLPHTGRFLTPQDIRRFAANPANELSDEMALRVAAGNDLCFGILDGERLAGYGWCALGSVEAEHTGGVALSLPYDVGYMYKGFTHPDYRGRGLNGIRMALAGRSLAQRGVRRLICLVDWANWASIQSCRGFGCQSLGRVTTFQIAGHRFWFMPKAAYRLGVRVGDECQARAARVVPSAAGTPTIGDPLCGIRFASSVVEG